MNTKTHDFFVSQDISVKQAMKKMTEIGQKTLFVADKNEILLGALSDGDIRKWILGGGSLRENIGKIFRKNPKFVKGNYRLDDVKKIMLDSLIEAIPVVYENMKIDEILTWERVFSGQLPKQKKQLLCQVAIMAGGKGTRLDPFTRILPKPLIPIEEKPIIEIIMDKFVEYGVRDFFVSVNHKAKMIKSYFEDMDGKYHISYTEEKEPLGTAGSLKLLTNKISGILVVTNCDVIVDCDYSEIVEYHKNNDYDITSVVSCRHYVIPYGVCEIENGGLLKKITEKPSYDFLVGAGFYVINKKVLNLIPKNKYFNFNHLIEKSQGRGLKVGVFPISEDSWIDIGQWEEYKRALEKMKVN